MAYAKVHGNRFTSRNYQKLTGLDIYGASSSIKDMIRKGAARSLGKGSRTYEIVEPFVAPPEMPDEMVKLLPELEKRGELSNKDIRAALNMNRQAALRTATWLVEEGWLTKEGTKRWTIYKLPK